MASRFSKILPIAVLAVVCALPFLFRSVPVRAQSPTAVNSRPTPAAQPLNLDRGAAGLWQSLLKLHTRTSLLMVTAHPDDEDGAMLTYESRGQGGRVTLLTLNRGEGGANVMSSDYFDALGLVRTEELLAADRYYGVQQFWTRMIDFGFSKTKEESLDKMGTRSNSFGCRTRRPHGAASCHHFRFRRRSHGRPQQSPGCRSDGARGFQGGGRPGHVSRADQRGAASLEAAKGLCGRALLPRHRQGDLRLCGRKVLPC